MTVSIRGAEPDDADAIATVQVATWQSAYRDILPAEFLSALSDGLKRRAEWWRGRVVSAEPRDHTLVAEQEGEVVGFADIGPSRDAEADPLRVGELNAIYVLSRAWGRGVGRALMAELLLRFRRSRFDSATLWVLAENVRGRRYYEAAGWTVDGTERDETIGDSVVRELRYRIPLGDGS